MAIVDSTTTPSSGARAPSPIGPAPLSASARHHATLYVRDGEAFHEAPAGQVLLQAQELIDQQFHSQCSVPSNPQLMRVFLKVHLGGRGHEVFAVLFLDARHRLIEYVELFRGTIDSAEVYSREVVKEALARNAAAVILAQPSFRHC